MKQGGFHLDLVGMSVERCPGNGEGWIELGFGWHECRGMSWGWRRVDVTVICWL